VNDLSDLCTKCSTPALASTPGGRMCAGHALLEATREWNQGNWDWTATFDQTALSHTQLSSSRRERYNAIGAVS